MEYNIKTEPGVKRELLITSVKREKVDLGAVEAPAITSLEKRKADLEREKEQEPGHNPDWQEWVQEEESRSSGSPDSLLPTELAENQFSYPRHDPHHCYDQYQYQEPYTHYQEGQAFFHHTDRPPLDFSGQFQHHIYPNWNPTHWPQEPGINCVTSDNGATYTMLQGPRLSPAPDTGLQPQPLRLRSVPEALRLPAPEQLPGLSDQVSSSRCDAYPDQHLPKVLTPIQTNIKRNGAVELSQSPDNISAMLTGRKKDPVPIIPRLAPTSCSNCGTTSTSLWRRDKVTFFYNFFC